jgi:hypothetical protein
MAKSSSVARWAGQMLGEACGLEPAELARSPRFQELVEIVDLAVQVHGEAARRWFVTPEPELGSVLPATLLRDPANGPRLVKQALMNHLRGCLAIDETGRLLPGREAKVLPARGRRRKLPRPGAA